MGRKRARVWRHHQTLYVGFPELRHLRHYPHRRAAAMTPSTRRPAAHAERQRRRRRSRRLRGNCSAYRSHGFGPGAAFAIAVRSFSVRWWSFLDWCVSRNFVSKVEIVSTKLS
jgi:hypothetical protein